MWNLRRVAGTSGARCALAVVALALFGLLSMHGWGSHAGMHVGDGSSPTGVAAALHEGDHALGPAASSSGQHVVHAATVDRTTHAATSSCEDGCGSTGSEGGMGLLGLCVAVVGGLLLFALAFVLLRRRIPLLRTMLPPDRHPVLKSRDHDPPDLLRLCVIRC